MEVLPENSEDDEFDPDLKQPVIKTLSQAENLAEQLQDFAHFNGHDQLSLALSKVNDLLHGLKLSRWTQSSITDFFS